MKRKNLFITLFLCASLLNYAQLGKLKKIVKDTQKETKKEENTPVNETKKEEKKETKKEEDTSVTKPIKEEKKEPKIIPDLPNDGITSPLHQKYMGKIVFGLTMESIEFKKEIETAFVTKANLGDQIRYRVYMDNCLVNYLKTNKFADVHGRYKIRFYLDGVVKDSAILSESYFTSAEKKSMTTFKGALKSAPGKTAVGEDQFLDFLRKHEGKFTMGDHKLKIEYLPFQEYPDVYTGPVVASGEITLSVKKSIVDPNDEKTCLPKAKMVDNVLSASILKAFKAKGWEEQPKEVRIISDKWNIVRNKYSGVIISRYVAAVIGSTKDGKCAYQDFYFYQDYDGTNYQKDVYLEGIGNKFDVSCGCFK